MKYSRYEIRMTSFKDKIMIEVKDNYFEKHSYAFCDKGSVINKDTLTSYDDVAVDFVAYAIAKIAEPIYANVQTLRTYGEDPHSKNLIVKNVEHYVRRI